MTVDPEQAAGQSEYEGEIYYFCCRECKRLFDQDPTNYVSEQPAAGMRP
jgi:YHS domain-containing protein